MVITGFLSYIGVKKICLKQPVLAGFVCKNQFLKRIFGESEVAFFMNISREIITSSQNKYVSLTRSLTQKKNRESERLFRFDGIKLMCEAILKGAELELILLCEGEEKNLFDKAEKLYGIRENDLNCKILTVSRSVFEKLSDEMAPEGVICVAKHMESMHGEKRSSAFLTLDKAEKILLLESVRDPQNVGAIIRVAAAFGVDRIVLSRDCADIYNAKTLRASMGTLFGMRIDKTDDFPDVVRSLTLGGRRVFAAALGREAQSLGNFELLRGDCVVIGNEGHGLSEETIEACSGCVYIPMAEHVESLNAATAAAVLVWEFFGSGRGGKNHE